MSLLRPAQTPIFPRSVLPAWTLSQPSRRQVCPVCGGSGVMPDRIVRERRKAGRLAKLAPMERQPDCHSCHGTGLV